jgi:hypothetical protein
LKAVFLSFFFIGSLLANMIGKHVWLYKSLVRISKKAAGIRLGAADFDEKLMKKYKPVNFKKRWSQKGYKNTDEDAENHLRISNLNVCTV